MAKAIYLVVKVTPDIVFIEDLYDDTNPTRTITNDAEAVVEELHAAAPGRRIVYKDTDGQWDELAHEGGKFKAFQSYHGALP